MNTAEVNEGHSLLECSLANCGIGPDYHASQGQRCLAQFINIYKVHKHTGRTGWSCTCRECRDSL